MFNFKKAKNDVSNVLISPTERIDKIHESFDTACDKILEEANRILNENNKVLDSISDLNMTEKLKNLGFTNIPEVTLERNARKLLSEGEAQINTSLYYKEHYPNHKFITHDYVKEICDKYSLVFSDVSNYIGDIPTKNRMEIINFKLRKEDRVVKKVYSYGDPYFEKYDEWNPDHNPSIKTNDMEYSFMYFLTASVRYDRAPVLFYICADKELIKLDNNQEIVNNEVVTKNLDPVVLAKTIHGDLVVSKWGKEENIEELKGDN